VAELMGRAPEGAIGVKLSTPRRGCSGLAYSVDYVTEENPLDEKIETPGGTFYVDGGSVLYLVGSIMDWREDDFAAASCSRTPTPPARAAAARASLFSRRCAYVMLAGKGPGMRLLGIAVLSLTPAAAGAVETEAPQVIKGALAPSKECPRAVGHYAHRGNESSNPRKLTELPPATAYMAVYRTINGCEVPLTVVDYRRGRNL
jgi:iron-sulfur cluster assembly protein